MNGIRMRQGVFAAAVIAMLSVAALGCGLLHAKAPGPTPALSVPEPPLRLVIPVSIDPPAATPAPTASPAPATPPRPTPAPARPTPTPTPTTTTTTPPPVDTPPPVLHTAAASLADLETRARERLGRAEKDLGRVSRNALGPDARDQYDSAARFIRMAKDAIAARILVYAAYCADKAATLAGLLVK
jgi:hypothetical protein